jgi:hypothetical protein
LRRHGHGSCARLTLAELDNTIGLAEDDETFAVVTLATGGAILVGGGTALGLVVTLGGVIGGGGGAGGGGAGEGGFGAAGFGAAGLGAGGLAAVAFLAEISTELEPGVEIGAA